MSNRTGMPRPANRPIPQEFITESFVERFYQNTYTDANGCLFKKSRVETKQRCMVIITGIDAWNICRIAYFIYKGIDPGVLLVCHHCDNSPCINEQHIFLGTTVDNVNDRVIKGRSSHGNSHYARLRPDRLARGGEHGLHKNPQLAARGIKNGNAKLTDEDVIRIKQMFLVEGHTRAQIYRVFADRISESAIKCVLRCKTWRHINI